MKGRLNKLSKLLCYLFVSIFVFGIGSEVVKAANELRIIDRRILGSQSTAAYFKFDATYAGEHRYAYCFDAPNTEPAVGTYFSQITASTAGVSEAQRQKIVRVLLAAGYPQYNYSVLGVNNEQDAFYVTQAGLWYAKYGAAGTSKVFTSGFHDYMRRNYPGYRHLMNAADNIPDSAFNIDNAPYELTINASSGNKLIDLQGVDNTMISESTFTVAGVSNYTVEVTDSDSYITSADGTQNYGTSKSFSESDSFRIAKSVSGVGAQSSGFTVTQNGSKTVYDIAFFVSGNNIQRMALLVPNGSSTANGSYELEGNVERKDFYVAKTGKNGAYVAGAWLGIYRSGTTSLVEYFETTTSPKEISLPEGDYYIREHVNPSGYRLNNERVYFHVNADGTTSVGGNVVEVVTISDEEAFIALKKVSAPGSSGTSESVAGATFVIYAPGINYYICGKTDAEGLLKVPDDANGECSKLGSDFAGKTNLLNSTGVYSLLDLEYSNFMAMYDLTVKELKAPEGYVLNTETYHISGPLQNRIGWYYGSAGAAGDVKEEVIDNKNVVVFEFVDNRYVDVRKTDMLDGHEVEGATMKICRKGADGDCEKDTEGNKIYVAYWVSTSTPYRFKNVEKDVMYILEEESSPKAYVKFAGKLDFQLVDDQGTVKMYNHSTGEEITNTEKFTAVMPNGGTETYISKTDMVTGEEIGGAHLKICTAANYEYALSATGNGDNCSAINEWDSVEGEEHFVRALEAGFYYLVETIAPDGYKMTNSVKFEVKNDGSINQVVFTNAPIKMVISKKNQVDGTRVAGAKFEILNASDRTIAKDYKGNELVWTSDGVNDWEITGILAGEYILVETQKPEGFQEGMIIDGELVNEYKFTVSNESSDLAIDAYITVLNAPNTGISTLNLFAIGGLMIFAGYETIKIYRRKALND